MSTDVIKLLSALLLCATQALAEVPAPAPPQSKSIPSFDDGADSCLSIDRH